MRADAAANRERLLDAAGEVIAEHGIGAPISAVAKRAGVGHATLYRNFADRHELLLALAARSAARFAAVNVAAEAADTGWEGIERAVDGAVAMFLDYPWLPAVLDYVRRFRDDDSDYERSARVVVERAWAEGSLRRDIEATDLAFIPSMLAGLLTLPEPVRSIVIARQRDIVLDGFRAPEVPRRPPGGAPLPVEDLRRIVRPAESRGGLDVSAQEPPRTLKG